MPCWRDLKVFVAREPIIVPTMSASTAGHPQRAHTILVVDDETEVRDAIRDFLTTNLDDVRVLTADSGQGGLDLLARQKVDLIISDFNMPGMNGVQFLEAAERLCPGVPHILITAFFTEALNQMGSAVEGQLVLQKPFVPDGLLRDIEDALAGRP